ncbi:netrin receptor unc-5 isoform X4 [Drosophila sulfurigaster albostrigata]|uniref:netrin receptor unc-5 isoform X4 n=1 Tax=Drosophila sulfurigaster albostrigata TaxID=89887 RepID=UPI002D21BC4B|nr:netrin receptor unc-5 isoform X4 [Drosophila sulfurigaster albostrigata]
MTSTSLSSVINKAGNVIVVLVSLQLIWLTLAGCRELPLGIDYGSMSASIEDVDVIDTQVTEESASPHRTNLDAALSGEDNKSAGSASGAAAAGAAGVAGAGTLLEEFNGGKLSAAEASNTLPIFLSEPESVFVVKNRPAVLKCKASHALQLHFKCSGSSQPPPSTHDKHVDPHTGVHMEEVTATIHRDLVDEYFGKGPFKCECQAWSSRGVVKSQAATVHIAFARWSSWSEWSICSAECIQVRRRKCLTHATGNGNSDVADEAGELLPGGVGAAALSSLGSSSDGATSSDTSNNNNGDADGPGYSKSLCAGKDIQTAECRGEQCQIGKDDFDWTLYLGLAFITAVCFAFGAALICCARRGIRANPHYNMARSVMDADYMPGVVDKKEMRMHIEAANLGYDYVNPGHRYLPGEHIVGMGMGVGVGVGGVTEHHYDVPNLSANYTNPIDDLSGDYLSDTGDSSTADTSNSTFDMNAKLSILNTSKSTSYELLGSSGGQLRLYGGELLLFVPELAIGKHLKKHVSLMLLSDECSRIACATESSILCSSVVHCAPRNYSFVKPVILKIPHSLLSPEQWHVHIYHADSEHDDLNVSWRRAVSVGEETINTPMFVQLEPTHVYIMTEQLGHFAVVAEPRIQQPAIKMKLLAFSQHTPPSTANCSLRIYVVKDFPNSKDICANVECKLGGSYLGESEVFAFVLNSRNLNIRVRSTDADAAPYEHAIPYQHILSNNSILHCEFSVRQRDQHALCVDFGQGDDLDFYTFSIPSQPLGGSAEELASTTNTTISIDRQGNYVNESCVLDFVQLPHATKRLICAALDPPRADERDWRLLAKKLSTDRYIAYFATKPSPTEQILNLWECRANNCSNGNGNSSTSISHANTIMALLLTLKEMGRQDVLDIIVETIGPLWI